MKGDKNKARTKTPKKSLSAKRRIKTLKKVRNIYLGTMGIMFLSLIVAAIYSLILKNYIVLFTSILVAAILIIPYFFK